MSIDLNRRAAEHELSSSEPAEEPDGRTVFVVFSVVGLDPSALCPYTRGNQSRRLWELHAERLWNDTRRQRPWMLLPPAILHVGIAVSESVLKACPAALASGPAMRGGASRVSLDLRVVDESSEAPPPAAVVIHSQQVGWQSVSFQRPIDYFAFHGDYFFADAAASPGQRLVEGFGGFASGQLRPIAGSPDQEEMLRCPWLAAVLRGPDVMQHEPTFPSAASHDALHRVLHTRGVVLSRQRARALSDSVKRVFVGSVTRAFSAAVAASPRSMIVSHHFAHLLLATVSNDECREGGARRGAQDQRRRPQRSANINCAWLL
jgi:hypothetical protein